MWLLMVAEDGRGSEVILGGVVVVRWRDGRVRVVIGRGCRVREKLER